MTDYAGPSRSVRVFCAWNSQREGRSLPRQGRDHLFLGGMGISVGFFTETKSFLLNPGVRRSPSYDSYFKAIFHFLNEVANLSRMKDFEICQFSVELLHKIWKIFKENQCVRKEVNLLSYFFYKQFWQEL